MCCTKGVSGLNQLIYIHIMSHWVGQGQVLDKDYVSMACQSGIVKAPSLFACQLRARILGQV